jgi:hypothetical protein
VSETLKKAFSGLRDGDKSRSRLQAQADGFQKSVEAVLASPELQALLKIQKADELGLSAAGDNEKIALWMERFKEEATKWRAGVDEVLGTQDELVKKEQAEQAAAAELVHDGAQKRALKVEQSVGARLLGLYRTDQLQGLYGGLLAAQGARSHRAQEDEQFLGSMVGKFRRENDAALASLQNTSQEESEVQSKYTLGVDGSARIQRAVDARQKEADRQLELKKQLLDKQIKGLQSGSHGMSLADRTAQNQTAGAPTSLEENSVQVLMDEALQLQEERQNLTSRHKAAGKAIQRLLRGVLRRKLDRSNRRRCLVGADLEAGTRRRCRDLALGA